MIEAVSTTCCEKRNTSTRKSAHGKPRRQTKWHISVDTKNRVDSGKNPHTQTNAKHSKPQKMHGLACRVRAADELIANFMTLHPNKKPHISTFGSKAQKAGSGLYDGQANDLALLQEIDTQ